MALVASQADIDHFRDRAVLGFLADSAVRDLNSRLDDLRPDEDDDAPSTFRLTDGTNGWSLWFELGEQAQIALRRRAAGSRQPPNLASISEAVAPEMVRLECHVGSATISAGDLAELNPGDLIELDQRITDALQLTIADRICLTGRARIIDEDSGPAVQIVESLDPQ